MNDDYRGPVSGPGYGSSGIPWIWIIIFGIIIAFLVWLISSFSRALQDGSSSHSSVAPQAQPVQPTAIPALQPNIPANF